jgi:diadenosine tetraphosphatase ApaH/serine/threonine PP2A family protein phosphatase
VLLLEGEYHVIGDLHGNLIDLLRILYQFPGPPDSKVLFLGDIVDRGPFSTEVTTLILALVCAYPDSVSIIRGNHEFPTVFYTYGFRDEITAVYESSELWNHFQQVFAWMPIAAVVNDTCFCVHGGISEHFATVKSIARLQRPIYSFDGVGLTDLLWSDPSMACEKYGHSPRGIGRTYGPGAVRVFLDTNNLLRIIRAHGTIVEGVQTTCNGKVTTVFSTSTGGPSRRNMIGFLKLSSTDFRRPFAAVTLPPGPIVTREQARFKNCCEQTTVRVGSLPRCGAVKPGAKGLPPIPTRPKVEQVKRERTQARSFAVDKVVNRLVRCPSPVPILPAIEMGPPT